MSELKNPSEEALKSEIQIDIGSGLETLRYGDAVAFVDRKINTGHFQKAKSVLHQLAALFPDDLIIYLQLLHIAVNTRDHSTATRLADEVSPHITHYCVAVALCMRGYRQAGKNDLALSLGIPLQKQLAECAAFQNEMGLCHISSGDKKSAVAAFNKAIEIDPRFIEPYMGRARLSAGKLDTNQISAMQQLAEREQLPDEENAILHFALAWAYEGIDADRHFDYLHRANAMISQRRPWNERHARMHMQKTKEFFTAEIARTTRADRIQDLAPIFIVGVPRSGTSLIEQILTSHDEVTGCGETGALNKALRATRQSHSIQGPIWTWPNAHCLGDYFAEIDAAYRGNLNGYDGDTPYFTDKTIGTEWWCGLIMMMYPRAKIIHCLRHPLDACLSMYQLHFSAGQNFTYDLRSIAKYYLLHIDLMDHWKAMFGDRIHTVHYEQLIDEQRTHTEALLEFCGLPWQESCMEFYRSKRAARTASDFQIKQPIYKSSKNRWLPYAEQLREAAEILKIDLSTAKRAD